MLISRVLVVLRSVCAGRFLILTVGRGVVAHRYHIRTFVRFDVFMFLFLVMETTMAPFFLQLSRRVDERVISVMNHAHSIAERFSL